MGRGRNSINELITLLSETFICEQFIFHFPFRESHPPTPTRTNSVKVSELCSTLFGNSFRILSLSSVSVLSVSILYLNSGLWPINQLQLIRRGRWHVVVVASSVEVRSLRRRLFLILMGHCLSCKSLASMAGHLEDVMVSKYRYIMKINSIRVKPCPLIRYIYLF